MDGAIFADALDPEVGPRGRGRVLPRAAGEVDGRRTDGAGAMAFLGTCPPDIPLAESAPNHSNRMIIHEDAMAVGTALYAAVALDECGQMTT